MLLTWPHGIDWRQHIRDRLIDLSPVLLQTLLSLTFLPYRAQLMLDAVCRTLYRLAVSHRKLLEWETADAAERRFGDNPWLSLWEMKWVSLGSLVASCSPCRRPRDWPVCHCFWRGSCRHLSRIGSAGRERRPSALWTGSKRRSSAACRAKDLGVLRGLCQRRRKLAATRQLSGISEGKDRPPRVPHERGAVHRLGGGLHDFGFLGLGTWLALLERNLESLEKLDRHRGHFYNWYVTTTLEPLPPRYVSTADSGNLAACLLTASQALRDAMVAVA